MKEHDTSRASETAHRNDFGCPLSAILRGGSMLSPGFRLHRDPRTPTAWRASPWCRRVTVRARTRLRLVRPTKRTRPEVIRLHRPRWIHEPGTLAKGEFPQPATGWRLTGCLLPSEVLWICDERTPAPESHAPSHFGAQLEALAVNRNGPKKPWVEAAGTGAVRGWYPYREPKNQYAAHAIAQREWKADWGKRALRLPARDRWAIWLIELLTKMAVARSTACDAPKETLGFLPIAQFSELRVTHAILADLGITPMVPGLPDYVSSGVLRWVWRRLGHGSGGRGHYGYERLAELLVNPRNLAQAMEPEDPGTAKKILRMVERVADGERRRAKSTEFRVLSSRGSFSDRSLSKRNNAPNGDT